MNNNKILVVDDEEDIVELMTFQLENDGFEVISANDGMEAVVKINKEKPTLVILDIMMPRMSGFDVVKLIRAKEEENHLPIIIVSAKSSEDDVVKGLDLGADDYVTKPFSLKVLSAKVKALIRRKEENSIEKKEVDTQIIELSLLMLNRNKYTCTLDSNQIELTATEFELLFLMASEPGRVFTRNQLINDSKGSDYPVTQRSIDVQVVSLRKKLGEFGKNTIKTVWGIGYKVENEV
ncbi:MAG: response regulator transcription factor [Spirochaetaceae bacterium]|nr:response regulator transcription factor [Spirochaetaceae bacterium]